MHDETLPISKPLTLLFSLPANFLFRTPHGLCLPIVRIFAWLSSPPTSCIQPPVLLHSLLFSFINLYIVTPIIK